MIPVWMSVSAMIICWALGCVAGYREARRRHRKEKSQ